MDEPSQEQVAVDPVPPVSIIGEPHEVIAHAGAPNVRLPRSHARQVRWRQVQNRKPGDRTGRGV
jgi:hypothetical protein